MSLSVEDINKEVNRLEQANAADWVVDERKKRQRELASSTIGKKVLDIVQFPDHNADDVLIWVFCAAGQKDLIENAKTVVQIVVTEPKQQRIVFDEVFFKGGKLLLADGRPLLKVLRDGSYNY